RLRRTGDDDGDGRPEEGVVRTRFVVAADGASGRTAARIGVGRDPAAPIAVAARRYYRVQGPSDPVFETWIGIASARSGRRLPGYGWALPTGDGAMNVGAFVIRPGAAGEARAKGSAAVSARDAFDAFLMELTNLPSSPAYVEADALGPVSSSAIPMGMDRLP